MPEGKSGLIKVDGLKRINGFKLTALELLISLENVIRIVQGEYTASVETALVEYGIYDDVRGYMPGKKFLEKGRYQFTSSRLSKQAGERDSIDAFSQGDLR